MRRSGKIIFVLGFLLIVSSFCLLFFLQYQTKQAKSINDEVVQIMETLLTNRREGEMDFERESEMPVLELKGADYVALLEIPSQGLKLPISNTWDKKEIMLHPCKFEGSAYDGTLIIGGYDQTGQFDFFDTIQDGAAVIVTDMTGAAFSYEVKRVERSDSAELKDLIDDKSDFTLFVRDAQLLEYIFVRCVMK